MTLIDILYYMAYATFAIIGIGVFIEYLKNI